MRSSTTISFTIMVSCFCKVIGYIILNAATLKLLYLKIKIDRVVNNYLS